MPLPFAKKKKYTCVGKSEDEVRDDFYQACREGKLDWIDDILTQNPDFDVNALSEDEECQQGLSPLHVACRYNQLECVKLLLANTSSPKARPRVDIEDRFGFRPIHDAALFGYTECVKVLLANGALTNGANGTGVAHVTPLFYAVQQNHKECVNLLIDKTNANNNDIMIWDLASKRGNTSLTSLTEQDNIVNKSITNWLKNSALTGHTSYLEKLKKTVGRRFGSREALDTILTAAQHGHAGYIRKLIEQGVDVNLKNKEGNGALHFAARYGHEDAIKLLVDSGADMDAYNNQNFSPLHIALRQGCLEGVQQLLKCGQYVNQKGGDCEETPLHMCLDLGVEDDMIRAILEYRPDLTLRNKDGELVTEVKCEFEELTQLVLEHARN